MYLALAPLFPHFRLVSYEPLHHKYRPQTFANLVGQEAIATTLTNAIRTERIAPAYLFTGSRGTGKTSSARILAKSLNCQKQDKPTESPCGVCEVCTSIASGYSLDVIEIDAASNTGVDNIREIIERTQFAPVQCRYKVYIIDEVHMLSTAAFNALLKTLEEPPARVVFVLATTDPQRVLPTIISRCQKFDFRRIPLEAMVKHLLHIASKENISITPDAITLVAQAAQGGLRDAESLLDQLSLLPDEVTVEAVWDLVGAVSERDLMALTEAIASNDSETVLDQCRRLMDRGREPLVVLQNLARFYLDLLIAKTSPNRNELVAITPPTWKQLCEFAQQLDTSTILLWSQHLKNSEVQVKNTTQPRLWLEVTLLGLLPDANPPQAASTTNQSPLQHSKMKRQESPTRREPEPPQNLTPSVPQHNLPANRATSDSRQHETQPPQEPTFPNSAPNQNQGVEPQPQQPAATTQMSSTSSSASIPVQPPTATVSAAEHPSNSEQSINQIWEQVLKHLHPFAAHALVSQHCHLLSFDGSVALVGISSQPLLKLAQEKLPNLQAAFEAVYKSQVKVSLQTKFAKPSNTAPTPRVSASTEHLENRGGERIPSSLGNAENPNVANADTPSINNPPEDNPRTESAYRSGYRRISTEPSSTVANEPKFQSTVIEQTPQATVTRLVTHSSLTLAQRQVQSELQPQEQFEVNRGSLTTTANQSPGSLSRQEIDADADEVEKALKDIKDFFEGEFVDLTDELSDTHVAASVCGDHESTLEDGDVMPLALVQRESQRDVVQAVRFNEAALEELGAIAPLPHQPQWSQVIDTDVYQSELDSDDYSKKQDSIEGHPALLREDGETPNRVHGMRQAHATQASLIAMNNEQSTMNKTAFGIPPHPMLAEPDVSEASRRLVRDGDSSRFQVEQTATHQPKPNEIADFDNTPKPLRRENLQYDEDGDIAF